MKLSIGKIFSIWNKVDQRRDPQEVIALLKAIRTFAKIDPSALDNSGAFPEIAKAHNDIRNVWSYLNERIKSIGYDLDSFLDKPINEVLDDK